MGGQKCASDPRRRSASRAACLVLATAAGIGGATLRPAQAQSAGSSDVLTGSQVTEQNLLEALIPDPGVHKRSLKVKATAPSSSAVQAPGRASASLLITFRTASSELTAGAKEQLDVVGTALKNARLASYKFTLEGHADPRGDRAANLVLSRERANSVRAYLVDARGIDPGRLVAEGKGDSEVLNRAYPAAPENRRVTIVTNLE
jgi:outer membrane protein OmpA-like peptidoglycan-associated protein